MSWSYLSLHLILVKAVLRLLWMISALSSATLSPSLWTLKFKRKLLICCQEISNTQLYKYNYQGSFGQNVFQ